MRCGWKRQRAALLYSRVCSVSLQQGLAMPLQCHGHEVASAGARTASHSVFRWARAVRDEQQHRRQSREQRVPLQLEAVSTAARASHPCPGAAQAPHWQHPRLQHLRSVLQFCSCTLQPRDGSGSPP